MIQILSIAAILAVASSASIGQDGQLMCSLPHIPDKVTQSGGNYADPLEALASLPDSLQFKNGSITLSEKEVSGTYSFYNGLLEGLSTIALDYDYSDKRATASLSIGNLKLTGLYEIINGEIDIEQIGTHTISGSGPVLGLIQGLNASVSFSIESDPKTLFISIADLKLEFGFENVTVSAANLVVDGQPIDWRLINESLRPLYNIFWADQKEKIEKTVQDEVNKALEGCELMDVIMHFQPKLQSDYYDV